ncbi:hypothetical protein DFJ73DRAFT_849170, partial [Zopfochytrium polystomum]
MSILPVESIHAITESVGIVLKDAAASALLSDVEYRLREIVHEAKKFMRHSKRTQLKTEDINHALRVKNVEPLYGHSSSSTAKFRSVPLGAQRLYYLEDQEVDLDDIIFAPLPPVPLDVTFTAHWLAVEGVQPAIVQNPSAADFKEALVTSRVRSANAAALNSSSSTPAVLSGPDAIVNGEILVKHVLSKELQMYYDKITESVLSEDNNISTIAIVSLENDTGIQPLLPYLVQFLSHTSTKKVRDLRVMWAMMRMSNAILKNRNLFIQPYLQHIIPVIVTGLVSKRIGETNDPHHALRDFASLLAAHVCAVHGPAYPSIQPRLTKTLLRAFLDPTKALTTRYGAIVGLAALGQEAIKVLLAPNAKAFGEEALRPEAVVPTIDGSDAPTNRAARRELLQKKVAFKSKNAEKCFEAMVNVIVSHILVSEHADPSSSAAPSDLVARYTSEDFERNLEAEYGIFGSAVRVELLKKKNLWTEPEESMESSSSSQSSDDFLDELDDAMNN